MVSVFDDIKERVNLVDLIGRSVELKRSGANFKALCPFHSENTASFFVLTKSNRWRCFGCNRSGDCFDWLVEHDQLSAGEALRTLAQQTGVQLEENAQRERDQRLLSALDRAQKFYVEQMHHPEAAAARDYLKSRDIGYPAQFGIGYAPKGRVLIKYLRARGFGDTELIAAGLATHHSGFLSADFFHNRIVFPIRDQQGRAIGFSGRMIGDSSGPKYVNSPDTAVFHKQSVLYAFDVARESIAKTKRAVVVEGQMDALRAHVSGFTNVVATMGTAVTAKHLQLLSKLADEIVIAMDPDNAGQTATLRSIQLAENALRSGVVPSIVPGQRQHSFAQSYSARVSVLVLPGTSDPDELIRHQPDQWRDLVENAVPVAEFVIERAVKRHNLSTSTGKTEAAREIIPTISAIANPIEQAMYVDKTAEALSVDSLVIRRMLVQPKIELNESTETQESVGLDLDAYALALMSLMPPEDVTRVEVQFATPQGRAGFREAVAGGDLRVLGDFYERVSRYAFAVSAQFDVRFWQKLDEVRSRLDRLYLFQQRADILAAMYSTDDAAERHSFAAQLSSVSGHIREFDSLNERSSTSGLIPA